jgi:hypothetical protein
MVWMFLLYDGLNQICKLSVYHLADGQRQVPMFGFLVV